MYTLVRICPDLGNTRIRPNMPKSIREKHSLYALGTFNNYSEDELTVFLAELHEKCKMFVMQEECGASGTKHLQVKICLLKSGRPTESFSCKKIHWEKSKRWKGWEYCCKDDTNIGRRWAKGVEIPDVLICDEPYGWQLDVVELVKQKPDPRKIYWYWEPNGKMGKSSLCRYLVIKHKAMVFAGKCADMKAAIALAKVKPKICIMDIPRCVEHISYSGIEEIKNGVFFSPKYESGMVSMNFPHFIVFSNQEPDLSKMSGDRWVVQKIE